MTQTFWGYAGRIFNRHKIWRWLQNCPIFCKLFGLPVSLLHFGSFLHRLNFQCSGRNPDDTMFGDQTSWLTDFSPVLALSSHPTHCQIWRAGSSHTRSTPMYFPNDPRSVLPRSSSPFPSFNNEKAKTVSKGASVYFGFCSVLRGQPPRVQPSAHECVWSVYFLFLLQLNMSSQVYHQSSYHWQTKQLYLLVISRYQ